MSIDLPIYPEVSMSSLDLWWNCQAWSVGAVSLETDPLGPPARFGNGIHLLMQWYLEGGEMSHDTFPVDNGVAAVSGVAIVVEDVKASDEPRFRRVWANLRRWLDENAKPDWQAEVAYAICPSGGTARELGRGIKREYKAKGCLRDEIPGTADIVIVGDNEVTVLDLKTGRTHEAKYRMQVMALAFAAARVHRVTRARAGILRANEQVVEVEGLVSLDSDQLDWLGSELKILHARADRTPHAGDWCKTLYCKGRKACPAAKEYAAIKPT